MHRRITVHALATSLGFALMLAHVPAQSSEVVRLARLVITGKRLSPERLEPVALDQSQQQQQQQQQPAQKTAAASPHADSRTTTTAQAPAGQDVAPRGPAPSRSVLSFF